MSGQSPHVVVVISKPKQGYILDNYVRLRLDRFGFSANNVTYRAFAYHRYLTLARYLLLPVSPSDMNKFAQALLTDRLSTIQSDTLLRDRFARWRVHDPLFLRDLQNPFLHAYLICKRRKQNPENHWAHLFMKHGIHENSEA